MRRKRYLLFPLFFFLFCLPFCAEAQVGEKKLTVEFKNEELSSVFKQLSKISGYKILFTYDDVKSYTYSGAIKDKNIREILDIVLVRNLSILSIRSLLPLQQKVLPNRLKCIR